MLSDWMTTQPIDDDGVSRAEGPRRMAGVTSVMEHAPQIVARRQRDFAG